MAVVQSERGALNLHSRQVLAAAALLADANTGVIAAILGEVEEDVGAFGADVVVALPDDPALGFDPHRTVTALEALIERWAPEHILLPEDERGPADIGRRLAASLRASVATHVVELSARGVACYREGGRAMARRDLPKILLLSADVAEASLPFLGRGERVEVAHGEHADTGWRDLGVERFPATALSLEEADFIISIGGGVRDVPLFQRLAERLGAALGASRVIVDDGKLPRDRQVGATGRTVSAGMYVAFGISGAVQHLQGIQNCRRAVAVNVDEAAPIMKRADLGIVADAEAVARALLHLVDEARGTPEVFSVAGQSRALGPDTVAGAGADECPDGPGGTRQ
jgi:electron transfer flavoprotein alpha subunit